MSNTPQGTPTQVPLRDLLDGAIWKRIETEIEAPLKARIDELQKAGDEIEADYTHIVYTRIPAADEMYEQVLHILAVANNQGGTYPALEESARAYHDAKNGEDVGDSNPVEFDGISSVAPQPFDWEKFQDSLTGETQWKDAADLGRMSIEAHMRERGVSEEAIAEKRRRDDLPARLDAVEAQLAALQRDVDGIDTPLGEGGPSLGEILEHNGIDICKLEHGLMAYEKRLRKLKRKLTKRVNRHHQWTRDIARGQKEIVDRLHVLEGFTSAPVVSVTEAMLMAGMNKASKMGLLISEFRIREILEAALAAQKSEAQ